MAIQTRTPDLGDGWRTGSSRPAGLYGELPPLPAHGPASTASMRQPPRKSAQAN